VSPKEIDVAALRRRRDHLQLRLRRQEKSRQSRELAARLHALGVRRLSRLPPARAQALVAPFAHWPGRDERFYWPEIPAHVCRHWEDEAQRDAMFREALCANFPAGARIAVVFHPFESALVLGREDAVAHAGSLLARGYAAWWIVTLRGPSKLVEVCFSDHEVCWKT
jgi:hypothetical protein